MAFKFEQPVSTMPTQEVGKALREQTGQKLSEAAKRFKGFGSRLFGGFGRAGIKTVDTLIGGAVKTPGVVAETAVSGYKAAERGSKYVGAKIDQWDQFVDRKTTEGLDWVDKKVEGGEKWIGDRVIDIQEGGKAAWGALTEKISQANAWKNRMIEAHKEASRQREMADLLAEQEGLAARNMEIQRRLEELRGINQLEMELNPEGAEA